MRSKTLGVLIAALTLTACASGAPQIVESSLNQKDRPDAALLVECPKELPDPKDGELPSLLASHVASAKIYRKCRTNNSGLIKWVREVLL